MPGAKTNLPSLADFVRRVMKLKGLTQKDVQRLSGGRITDGYIASISSGRASNLSVEKIKALADGIGVDLDTLFHVACGVPGDKLTKTYTGDALMILEIVQKAVTSPDVSEILNEAERMSPDQRSLLLKSLKRASKSKKRRTKPPRN